jgi:hypothetical protein
MIGRPTGEGQAANPRSCFSLRYNPCARGMSRTYPNPLYPAATYWARIGVG